MKHFAFINPWVHDFSYYNLWSAPLGLYHVMEYFSQFDCRMSFVDCASAPVKQKPDGRSHVRKVRIEKPEVYKKIPRYYHRFGISVEEFESKITAMLPVDAFFVTSHMAYWYGGVKETIAVLKKIAPKVQVIVGGIYATLYPEHARRVLGCERVYEGSVGASLQKHCHSCEETVSQCRGGALSPPNNAIECILWPAQRPATTLRHSLEGRNPERSNVLDPSAAADGDDTHFAPIKTSYGCPFNCTYCAAPILDPTFLQRKPQEVIDEISKVSLKGVRHFSIYDDALLVNAQKHFIPIFGEVAEKFPDAHFYTPVGVHSRLITKDVARTMKRANFSYLRVGYETKDATRQKTSGGKIFDEDLLRGLDNLCSAGYSPKDVGVFTMFGLPNQPFSEVVRSVEWLKKLEVSVILTEYSPIKGTKNAQNVPLNILEEPLYTNNTAYSYLFSGYNWNDVQDLKKDLKKLSNKI